MNLVAIETATETVGVAVQTERDVRAEFRLTGQRHHVESLAPALEHCLAQVGMDVGDLRAVVVDLGPGLFTGLRVGVAAAKGLAQAVGIGVIGFTSLDVLFRAAADRGHAGPVLAAVDARRGEVFAALRDLTGGEEVLPPARFTPAELVAALQECGGAPILAVGDGAQRYAEAIGVVPHVTCVTGALAFPPPATMLTMAEEHLATGAIAVDPALVVPIYMREADAVSNFRQVVRANPPVTSA
ncbi:MAG TPA: tRNA (adenosine(37)-N6)-threonylcarbamoyltransferase complex dimerization subunit type 1 TsaB [Acidimicrobiales bacterium]|jgi:tRNA threonylcarbamoyladenosine biosynthesis protein TsaB|nr:tRNA (adenosine(37)-N6)-threonylcarbamoyltransferase complex dimerization subunit type 1 TsaB [Acidimicrobiales bacterium]